MNKLVGLIALVFMLLSCDKQKKCIRQLDGDWEIKGYQEIIYDGTTNFYVLQTHKAYFHAEKKQSGGSFMLKWNAFHASDTSTQNLVGNFVQISEKSLLLAVGMDTFTCEISRQLKKDMTLEMILQNNRKSILQLHKK